MRSASLLSTKAVVLTCTIAAVIAFLGYMPPKGTEIIVPRSEVAKYSMAQRVKARLCAAKHGIKWRIDEGR